MTEGRIGRDKAGGDRLIGYFGFGSLVNRHTLRTDFVQTIPATLKGWRRHWQCRSELTDIDVALLSIHQDDNCSIKGMLVVDRLENLASVDAREHGYNRVELCRDDIEVATGAILPEDLYVYVAKAPADPGSRAALLQSYLDAVMQGYYQVFGADGVRHFMTTTAGFERGLIADRNNPFYPRSVALTDHEAEFFDSELARAGVTQQVGAGK